MMFNSVRTKPLFYAAIFLAASILFQNYFLPSFWLNRIAKNDVSLFAGKTEEVFLGGIIVSEVEERETFYGDKKISFDLKAQKLWRPGVKKPSDISGKGRVYLKNPKEALLYGDEVVLKGGLEIPKGLRNEGGFNTRAYLDRKGIRALFYGAKDLKLKVLRHDRGNPVQANAIRIKRFLSRGLSGHFSKRDAGFLKALFLGERGDLEEDFKDLFVKTGTLHILSVSGFNIGFLCLTLFFLLKPLPVSRNLKNTLILAAIWLYCVLVGWQAPVVRASIMASVFILGDLLGRKASLLNSLGLAALVILLVSPKDLFDVGFQLSFLAVFGIAVFVPVFIKRPELFPNEKLTVKEKVYRYASELFWVSFVCLFVSLPVTTQNFYIVTPLSLVANMIVVPVSFLVFFLGFIFFFTFWWFPKFLGLIPFVVKILMEFFVNALFFIEHLPGAYFIVGRLHSFLWIVLVLGIVYFFCDPKIKNHAVRAVLIVFFCFNVFLAQDVLRHFGQVFRMTVLDVGQGDAIYFEFPEGGNMLIDAGPGGDSDKGRWVVAPFLKSKGVRSIDALVISHPQADHIGGMPTVFDEFKVKNVVHSGAKYDTKLFGFLKNRIQNEKSRVLEVHKGQKIEGFADVEVDVLNPPKKETQSKNINDESVVLKINYGHTSFLLTGDSGKEAMSSILQGDADIHSSVLKVPHHGAKLGTQGEHFVRAVNPKVSIVSVGGHNPYKHPSPVTLGILNSLPECEVYRTDGNGQVSVVSDGYQIAPVAAVPSQ